MKALIQRVTSASIVVETCTVGAIERGLLVFIGVEKNDSSIEVDKMINKLLSYRVFSDLEDKMNLSVSDVAGGVLLVSQFTLAADTKSGARPGFSTAKPPVEAEILYDYMVERFKAKHGDVASGIFGAEMQVSLVNDGPVTFLLTC
ncbi:MAG: D-aminoacyl-tRNA deacylase [Gammaproteobacteria bacterium]|nr:D-aminoacyl-tRNA deacylase [Gammaproteobacteria bacterium]